MDSDINTILYNALLEQFGSAGIDQIINTIIVFAPAIIPIGIVFMVIKWYLSMTYTNWR